MSNSNPKSRYLMSDAEMREVFGFTPDDAEKESILFQAGAKIIPLPSEEKEDSLGNN